MSPPTISPAPWPAKSKTRASWPRSSANGRACIPNSVFLPRKFKIAVSGSEEDRAAVKFHDIGIEIVKSDAGEVGYRVLVGGGMGRTPYVAQVISDFVGKEDILAYLEAILRVYNQSGRRDNIYKARIKILVNALGAEEMRKQVAREFEEIKQAGTLQLPPEEMARIAAYFAPPAFEALSDDEPEFEARNANGRSLRRLVPAQSRAPSRAGLCHRHDLA